MDRNAETDEEVQAEVPTQDGSTWRTPPGALAGSRRPTSFEKSW